MEKVRLKFVDELKGLSILLVVLGHLYYFSGTSDNNAVNKFLGFTNMPILMFISGYLCLVSKRPFKEILNKIVARSIKYLVPMLVVSWGLMFFLLEIPGVNKKLLMPVLQSGFLGNWYWYLKVLIIFSFISIPLFLSKRFGIDLLMIGSTYILFTVLWRYGGALGDNLRMEHATTFYPFFAFGLLVKKYAKLLRIIQSKYTTALCFVIFSGMFVIEQWPSHLLMNLSIHGILPFTAIVFLWNIFQKFNTSSNKFLLGLEYCGKYSLEIYLFHYFFLAFVNVSPFMVWGMHTNNELLIHSLLLILALLISVFSIVLGKLLHCDNLLNKLVFGVK